jgi:PAS domain S-box-containing protein
MASDRLGHYPAPASAVPSASDAPATTPRASTLVERERPLPELTDALEEQLPPRSFTSEYMSPLAVRESLDMLVRLIERVAPGTRGSILLLDPDGLTLRHGAAPHLPPAYCKAIDGAQIGPQAGSCGTAAYRRERVIVTDIATDFLWEPYRALAAQYGLAACWSTPILDGDGSVLGTFAMYYDMPASPSPADIALTESATHLAKKIINGARAAESLRAKSEALRASERHFREMAEAIPVQVWTAQPDGQLDFVTRRTAEFFGRPAEAMLGHGWTDAVHPDDIERVAARWSQSLQTGEPYEVEFRLRAHDGTYQWHLVRANALRGPDGRIVQWFGCNADIEQQKLLEAALDDALADARSANKAKADFLAMVSHELRTPLNAIGGYAQLMLDDIPTPASPAQRNYLTRIVKSQQHLLSLIEAVLTHAKAEAGKIVYRITDVRAGEVLDVVESLTAPQRSAKRLDYDCSRCDGALTFRADKEKLLQILLNIISNAAKFTPHDGRITVATSVPSPGTGAFTVSDTGVGMSAEQIATIFEPFVQFENPLSREHKGIGLGMPISRELARGMGGDLVAASEPGAGSTFTLSLPLAGASAP